MDTTIQTLAILNFVRRFASGKIVVLAEDGKHVIIHQRLKKMVYESEAPFFAKFQIDYEIGAAEWVDAKIVIAAPRAFLRFAMNDGRDWGFEEVKLFIGTNADVETLDAFECVKNEIIIFTRYYSSRHRKTSKFSMD